MKTAPFPHARAVLGMARELGAGLRDFLLPAACASCRAPLGAHDVSLVCRTCWSRAAPLVEPTCLRCGHPRLSPHLPRPSGGPGPLPDQLPPCRWCERLPPFVRSARSFCRMDIGTGSAIVHALKYGGWPAVAPGMAARMARLPFPADVIAERTAVVPVPLSRTRLRERGYNQAEAIARALAREWSLPLWTGILGRTRDTRSQVQLTPSERARNVSNAFCVVGTARAALRGSHIVLVDDVITTAATLNAAATALMDGGARILSYVSFGRAPEPGDRSVQDAYSDE
jgi:ComF family protein